MPRSMTKPDDGISFGDVFRFVSGYWRKQSVRLRFILFFVVAAAFVETNLPNALSAFLNKIRTHAPQPVILTYLAIFLGNYLLQVILRWGNFNNYNRFETRVFKELMDDAFAQVHAMSEQFFVNTFTGSIISRITRARNRIEGFEDQVLLRLLSVGVVLAGSMFFLAMRFPVLAALVTLYIVVLLGISAALIFKVVGPSQSDYADAQDHSTASLADAISGIVTTKAYAQEDREIDRFSEVTEALRQKNLRAYIMTNYTGLAQQLLLCGMLGLLLGGGTWYYLHGKTTVEDIAYLSLAYTIIQSYVRDIGDNIKNLLTSSYELHAIVALMRQKPGVRDVAGAAPLRVARGAIDFDGITFVYPGKPEPVFRDFSLSIRAGERVALVGHSGSGKTSLIRLLQRSYDLAGGAIRIDGQDIAQVTQQSLRAELATVPQDPVLFHRTLADNIAYGRPNATHDEVRRAAHQAHIDDFIMRLPEGYETMVGERGVKLSGGERQRVAVARAILANRPILILDEATSALDSESERAIQDALRTLLKGRTSIMIAHRLSTILDADRIVVMDNGRVVEEGTHAQLLARRGAYASFFDLQSGGLIGDGAAESMDEDDVHAVNL
jgi:ATP-binding cassette subfamily B protein